MANALYTAEAHVTGGRANGHGRSSDGVLEVDLRLPSEMGGEGGGTNPDQLFAVGYAACFEGALGTVARREKVELGDVAIDADDAQAVSIVAAAHEVCPYSNATRGNVDVTLSANGQPVG